MEHHFIPEPITIQQKAQVLIDLLEDGYQRLIKNRQKAHERLLSKFNLFICDNTPFSINRELQQKEFKIQ